MIKVILGKKISQTQDFDEKGQRHPVTYVEAGPCPIVSLKEKGKDGYWAVVLGFGEKKAKNITKPILGIFKKAGLKTTPRFLEEVSLGENLEKIPDDYSVGREIKASDIFKVGDIVDVSGVSIGKGFAGVVKRHGFAGGPKTHGQSDRERAPGSIGQSTTPGRVYKGKRMAGRMGGQRVTVKNLNIFKIIPEKNILVIKGLVPGAKNGLLRIKKA